LIDGLAGGGFDEDGNPVAVKPEISIYTSDTFTDLCRGPHVENSSQINPEAIQLLNVAGAYWRGDEKRPMLQRIYGTAWETKEDLENIFGRSKKQETRSPQIRTRPGLVQHQS